MVSYCLSTTVIFFPLFSASGTWLTSGALPDFLFLCLAVLSCSQSSTYHVVPSGWGWCQVRNCQECLETKWDSKGGSTRSKPECNAGQHYVLEKCWFGYCTFRINRYLPVVCSGMVVYLYFPCFSSLGKLSHRWDASPVDKVQHQLCNRNINGARSCSAEK